MDDSPAAGLPVELWIKIAVTLRDTFRCKHGLSSIDGDPCPMEHCDLKDVRAVRPLSETCRFLHTVVQPIMYEYIDLGEEANSPNAVSIASTLMAQPHLRSSVRTIQLLRFHPGVIPDIVLTVLPHLVEVRFLSLVYGTVDSTIVALLLNATHLRTLHLKGVFWETNVPENWSRNRTFGASLQALVLHDPEVGEPGHASRTSQLFVPSLKRLEVTAASVVEYMGKVPGSPSFGRSLIEFTSNAWNTEQQHAIIQLLFHCPKIERLVVLRINPTPDMEANFLPNLQSIEGNTSLVVALVRGRPVRCVKTAAKPEMFADPQPGVEELCISSLYLDNVSEMLGSYPNLIRLEMRCSEWRSMRNMKTWIDTSLTSDVAALPRLQILHVRWKDQSKILVATPIEYPLSEEMQKEREAIMQMKREHCPDLYDVWLQPEHAWTYDHTDNLWVPRRRIMRERY